MSYEDANRIGQLNASYPEEDVSASGGAQHIRMIKKILRDAFQNTDEIPVDFAEIVYKDYLKDRLPIVGSGNPNGGPEPVFKGQRYFDNSTDPWTQYFAMVEGDNNSWVSEYRFGTFEVDNLTAYQDASLPEGTTVGGTSIATLASAITPVFSSNGKYFREVYWDYPNLDSWNTVILDNIFDDPASIKVLIFQIVHNGGAYTNHGGSNMWMRSVKDTNADRTLANRVFGKGVDIDNGTYWGVYNNATYFVAVDDFDTTDVEFYISVVGGSGSELYMALVGYI